MMMAMTTFEDIPAKLNRDSNANDDADNRKGCKMRNNATPYLRSQVLERAVLVLRMVVVVLAVDMSYGHHCRHYAMQWHKQHASAGRPLRRLRGRRCLRNVIAFESTPSSSMPNYHIVVVVFVIAAIVMLGRRCPHRPRHRHALPLFYELLFKPTATT